jgi:hypothetical protein
MEKRTITPPKIKCDMNIKNNRRKRKINPQI